MAAGAKPLHKLSVLDGVAIMVGIVLGIGIFRTPPLVAANVGSEAAFIGVWLLGGLAVLIGALCYAELAASHPNVGGEYHFLRRAFGRKLALLFAWARCTVIQPGAIAAIAFVYGDYMQLILPLGTYGVAAHAVISIMLLTGTNIIGTTQSKTLQVVLTGLQLLAVAIVVVVGLSADPASVPAVVPQGNGGAGGALGLAMVFVLLTYGGWNEAAYISGELRDAHRAMIRVLIYGTLTIVVTYLAINIAYLNLLGLEGLRATDAPAAALMRAGAGEAAVVALSVIVALASLSSINGTIFTGARSYYALGRDVPQLPGVGSWNERGDTPLNGLLLQGGLSLGLVALGAATRDGFQAMVDFTAPVFWFFMLCVSLALFVLRHREPNITRPFRVPLYPVLPALFTLTCLWLLYSSLVYTGVNAIFGIAILAAGLPLLLLPHKQDPATGDE